MKKADAVVILDDIRSSHNVGSIFRTADALSIDTIYLAGYTPAPKDKFGRVNTEISKVALGAEQTVAWEAAANVVGLIKKLKKAGYKIVGVEQDARAGDYKKFKFKNPTAFIFGNEVDGLSKKVLTACDEIVQIPMHGQKESLNVSVAFGIAMARVLNL